MILELYVTFKGLNLYSGSSNKYYLSCDQVGSLRLVTDAAGNVVKQVDYDTFGYVMSDTNPSMSMPFGFAGGLYDKDTGIIRFGARDYDPDTGRWTAKDPILFNGGDTDLYGYCVNDPVNFIDSNGLDCISAEDGKLIVDTAKKWKLTPYLSGGTTKAGADCSGSTWAIYNQAGFPYDESNRPSASFPNNNPYFSSVNNPQAGDIGWWKGHMLIYDPNAGPGMNSWSAHHEGVPYGPANTSWWGGKPQWYRYCPPTPCSGKK